MGEKENDIKTKGKERKKKEKIIKNRPESTKNYLPVSSSSAKGFACIELVWKIEYNALQGKLNVVSYWLYARHQNIHCYN